MRSMSPQIRCATLVLAATNTALAAPLITGQIFVTPSFSGGSGPFSQTTSQAGTVDIFGAATGGFNSSGHAAVHVEYGTVRASGQALGSLNANAQGSFRDDITITAPGIPTGTNGTLTFSVISSGTVASASGSSATTWTIRADIGGGVTDLQRSATQYSPELASGAYVGDPVGTHSATVAFKFGMAMPMSVQLQCSAGAANSPGPHAGESHYGSPFVARWGGITQVLIGSSPVPSFTISSSSGTNWANPALAYCPGDLNSDGFVDDNDFVAFAAAYNILDCSDPAMPAGCPADLNADSVVDDLDFVAFAAAYNELVCP